MLNDTICNGTPCTYYLHPLHPILSMYNMYTYVEQIDCIIYQAVAKKRAEIPDLMGQKMPGISHHISESFFCHVKTMCKSIIFLRDILICVWNAHNQSKSNGRERLRECFLFFTITSKVVCSIDKRWQKYLYYTYLYVDCSTQVGSSTFQKTPSAVVVMNSSKTRILVFQR